MPSLDLTFHFLFIESHKSLHLDRDISSILPFKIHDPQLLDRLEGNILFSRPWHGSIALLSISISRGRFLTKEITRVTFLACYLFDWLAAGCWLSFLPQSQILNAISNPQGVQGILPKPGCVSIQSRFLYSLIRRKALR